MFIRTLGGALRGAVTIAGIACFHSIPDKRRALKWVSAEHALAAMVSKAVRYIFPLPLSTYALGHLVSITMIGRFTANSPKELGELIKLAALVSVLADAFFYIDRALSYTEKENEENNSSLDAEKEEPSLDALD